MSTGSPQRDNAQGNTQGTTSTIAQVATYAISILALIGLFVGLYIGKVDTQTALPLVSAIVFGHGGAAIANQTSK